MNGHVELGSLIDLQPMDGSPRDDDMAASGSSDARELTERIELIEFLWYGTGGVQPVLLAVRRLLE
jgi:hypothetical protein